MRSLRSHFPLHFIGGLSSFKQQISCWKTFSFIRLLSKYWFLWVSSAFGWRCCRFLYTQNLRFIRVDLRRFNSKFNYPKSRDGRFDWRTRICVKRFMGSHCQAECLWLGNGTNKISSLRTRKSRILENLSDNNRRKFLAWYFHAKLICFWLTTFPWLKINSISFRLTTS